MKHNTRGIWFISLAALIVLLGSANGIKAQDRPYLSEDPVKNIAHPSPALRCKGPITRVEDVGFEGLRFTTFNWSNTTGGGESGRFDPTPLLSTTVTLADSTCLDAHLSAMVGSKMTYSGFGVSSMTMFQVTLTPLGGTSPQHMFGHYENPFGQYGPSVSLSAEHDVDMLSSNFFQTVGSTAGAVPPGTYRVDVWWSGGPVGGGGAIGADFVLKLYLR